jgi:uncharacterized protein
MAQTEVIDIIKQYIRNLKAGGLNIQFALLYGSFARNESSDESDIDVMLVSEDFDTNDDLILSEPWLPKYRHDFRIEPIAIGSKRFETDEGSPIIEIAKKEGIKIQV